MLRRCAQVCFIRCSCSLAVRLEHTAAPLLSRVVRLLLVSATYRHQQIQAPYALFHAHLQIHGIRLILCRRFCQNLETRYVRGELNLANPGISVEQDFSVSGQTRVHAVRLRTTVVLMPKLKRFSHIIGAQFRLHEQIRHMSTR